MKFLFFFTILLCNAYAITLQEIRQNLKTSEVVSDTLEIREKMTITTSGSPQQVIDLYLVKKGSQKVFMELKSALLNQRTIVSGERMQVTDLKTKAVQILPFRGNQLQWQASVVEPNPLDSGEWSEPVFIADSLYLMSQENRQVTYNSRLKKIVEIQENLPQGAYSIAKLFYDEKTHLLKQIQTEVQAGSVISKTLVEILLLRSAKEFPDRFFEF